MKNLFFTCLMLSLAFSCFGQFVLQPLNYPAPGYWPVYISIADAQHVWIGTTHESFLPYSESTKTTDGGTTWTHSNIPVPGQPYCTSVCEWSADTCFYVFTDIEEGGGSIWKTTDGGTTWSSHNTTQFEGGFANFYHAFSADTGMAMGDPTAGYFEIQHTYNGGLTWNRLPSIYIPDPLPEEMGLVNSYSAVGNSIWFATSMGRCFRSTDRGHNWQATQVTGLEEYMFNVCFSTELKGAFFIQDEMTTDFAVTEDGGVTWDSVAAPAGYYVLGMSRVGGFDGGFVFSAWKNFTDVFFTPDMFRHYTKIGSSLISSGAVSFFDASTGWLAGGESGTNEIYKYMGVLTSAGKSLTQPEKLTIIPNPASTSSLVRIPGIHAAGTLTVRVVDMCGRTVAEYPALPAEWVKLDASSYRSGVYVLQLFSGNTLLGSENWVIEQPAAF